MRVVFDLRVCLCVFVHNSQRHRLFRPAAPLMLLLLGSATEQSESLTDIDGIYCIFFSAWCTCNLQFSNALETGNFSLLLAPSTKVLVIGLGGNTS